MKLKKIAALALAGVMAVSMLAGCATKAPTTTEETTDMTGAVIAALSADTTKKVEFKKDSELDEAIAALAKKEGTKNFPNALKNEGNALKAATAISATLKTEDLKPALEPVTGTYVEAELTDLTGASVEYVAKTLAGKIDATVKNAATDEKSSIYTLTDGTEESGYLTYGYTGTVSVYTQTDATTGVVSYYMVYTLTRTATANKV